MNQNEHGAYVIQTNGMNRGRVEIWEDNGVETDGPEVWLSIQPSDAEVEYVCMSLDEARVLRNAIDVVIRKQENSVNTRVLEMQRLEREAGQERLL